MIKMSRLILIFALWTAACTNLGSRSSPGTGGSGNPAVMFTGSGSASYTHVLKNIVPSVVGTNTQLSLSVDSGVTGFSALTGFCSTGGGPPCSCQLNWKQTDLGIDRQRKLPVIEVQSGLVRCVLTNADWDAIAMGTVITMNIVPGTSNGTGLNVKPLAYKKGTVLTTAGDFLDSTLTPFRNIHRYTCHSKRTSPHEIVNKYLSMTNSSGNTIKTMLSSCFCTGDSSGGAGSASSPSAGIGAACEQAECPSNIRNGFSAQNYYRNFYIQSDKVGLINSSNDTYDCPRVLEGIKTSATSSGVPPASTVPSTERGKFYPLDTTFALSTTSSSEWSVGIRAASVLLKPGDPNTAGTSEPCTNASLGFTENGVYPKCLGYAKKPKSDGTCGTIQDSNGKVRPLVRLRRYRAMLPSRFSSNGNVEGAGNSQNPIYPAVDEVYVADRLVINSSGLATGDLIYGPKPCNYAWFDHEGVVSRSSVTTDFYSNLNLRRSLSTAPTHFALPQYVSTSKFYKWGSSPSAPATGWNSSLSVNPDGLVFPNEDYEGLGVGSLDKSSCSANLPVVSYIAGAPSAITLITSYREASVAPISFGSTGHSIDTKEIHLRPVDPWTPQYLEDTSFEACVPLADPYLEPPLHFFRDSSSNYAWCAEVYPNQNPNWVELNKKRKPKVSSTDYNDILANWTSGGFGPHSAQVAWYSKHGNTLGAGAGSSSVCSSTPREVICSMSDPAHYADCVSYLADMETMLNPKSNACDRTAMFDGVKAYKDFPLLANEGDVADMLKNDLAAKKNFACTYSVSSDPNKVNKQYPSTGCCGIKGGQKILSDTLIPAGSGGHLEPYKDGSLPDIRYCGHPVK
jgi:hypothetical protein